MLGDRTIRMTATKFFNKGIIKTVNEIVDKHHSVGICEITLCDRQKYVEIEH